MLGEEAAETLKQLKDFLEILEEAGYIRKKGNQWELTPRGVRKLGEKALGEIYAQLKKSNYGKHLAAGQGAPAASAPSRHEALRVRRPVPPPPRRDDHERHLPRRPAGARQAHRRTTSRSTSPRR